MNHEMFQYLPWPFPNNEFPADLGAVVMRSVLDGVMPALQVLHDPEGGWAVADGVGDPNDQRALVVTHIRHVTDHDPSLNELATMPPGTEANRESVNGDWELSRFTWDD
jgi:hypothetical protein